ncbi:transketolase [Prauserella endophytica]|uniref:transketolase n=1 Tax=Prauserella endophytica TaxID=1592324 RepID=UPI001E48998F|nr:transketolase [Prauserella endophytica]
MLIRATVDAWKPAAEEPADLVEEVRDLALFIRCETVRLIGIAKSGHFTSVFSCAELLAALYSGVLRVSEDPAWPDRDRLILSKGHCAVGLYPVLANLGYFPHDWLDTYTRVGSPLGDHPDMRRVPGTDFSSGSLGHGLSIGAGMALGNRMAGRDESRVWVLTGDQELNEGQIWEAAQAASHYRLGNLVAVVDRNRMGLDGTTEEVMSVEPIADRFRSFGWEVTEIDGHDARGVLSAFAAVGSEPEGRPKCVIANTRKGRGVPYMDLSRTWHLGYLEPADAEKTLSLIERV